MVATRMYKNTVPIFEAPVGVLLAVLGYAVGTYGAYACGLLLQQVFLLITH